MQRCLYSFAVRSLIRTRPEVEARLVYPRSEDQSLVLDDTEETLADPGAISRSGQDPLCGRQGVKRS